MNNIKNRLEIVSLTDISTQHNLRVNKTLIKTCVPKLDTQCQIWHISTVWSSPVLSKYNLMILIFPQKLTLKQ